MYRKRKKRVWLWILLVVLVVGAGGGFWYYKQLQASAQETTATQEEIVLEDGQELKYYKITQILGNEMTATVLEEDGTETSETVTKIIPVGTEVVTKLGTTTTFARLASSDTLKVLVEDDEILKIWITDLTSNTLPEGATDMEMPSDMSTGDMPDMSGFDGSSMPDMSGFDGSSMPSGGDMPSGGSMPSGGGPGGM